MGTPTDLRNELDPEPRRGRVRPRRRRLRPDGRELAAIFVGGVAGAVVRALLARAFGSGPTQWPWAIFAINVSGAFALAYLATRLQERLPLSTYRAPLLGTGFCGAYTTFSTMQLEILEMVRLHRYGLAAGYGFASLGAGFAAIWLATALTRRTRAMT